jgi:hypothetical protein
MYDDEFPIYLESLGDELTEGKPMDTFDHEHDNKVKVQIFNEIFEGHMSVNKLSELDEKEIDYPLNSEMDMTRRIISEEKGRIFGFLHDSSRAMKKLKRQFESYNTTPIGMSLFERNPYILDKFLDKIEVIDNFNKATCKALLTMPFNTSSGETGKTALQYIMNSTPDELVEIGDQIPRQWKISFRLDQGNSKRAI